MKRIMAVILTVLVTGCIAFPAFASPVDTDTSETNGTTIIILDDDQYVISKKSPYMPENSYGPGTTPGNWYQDDTTKRYYFAFLDGHRVHDQWEKISGKWYYFDSQGFILQNQWLSWKGKWYCLGPDGAMYVSCMTPDGYFVDENGAWIEHMIDPNYGPGGKTSTTTGPGAK